MTNKFMNGSEINITDNFINSQNYFTNNSVKTRYLANEIISFFERISIIVFGLIINYYVFLVFFYDSIFVDEIDGLVISFLSILFFIMNGGFFLLLKEGIKGMLVLKTDELMEIYHSNQFTIKPIMVAVFLGALGFLLGIIFMFMGKLNNLANPFSYGLIFLLALIGGLSVFLDDTKKNQVPIIFVDTLFSIVLAFALFCKKIFFYIARILLFIFKPIVDKLQKKRKFYSLTISGEEVIEFEEDIYIIR